MEQLREDLTNHMEDDKEALASIDTKLEKLLIDVVTIKSQWKVVGAVAGALTGVLGAVIGAMLGSCG
jgi:hypothetical protein